MKYSLFRRLMVWVVVGLVWGVVAAGAQDLPRPVVVARPAWVEPLEPDLAFSLPSREVADGYYYTLMEKQVHADRRETWYHYTYRVESELGVQNNSELRFTHAPEYETLAITGVRVYRDGAWKSLANRSGTQVMREESGSYSNLYDGRLTTLLVLEDIRPGDIIDYEFMIRGRNPIFGDRYAGSFSAGTDYRLRHFQYRLLGSGEMAVKVYNADWPVREAKSGGLGEWVIRQDDLEPVDWEDGTPDWFYAEPWIQVSAWASWEEVARWGTEVFAGVPGQDVSMEDWRTGGEEADTEALALEALRFVQNQVRYLGFEMGENSHRPYSPRQVLDRRFGDCKDKSLLLVTMLRDLGWEAWPVLVDTEYGEVLGDHLPSPLMFDHAIVRVRHPDGREWYVDPTATHQGGDWDHLSPADYGMALPLDGQGRGLVPMPEGDRGSIELTEVFDSPSADGRTTLVVTTVYQGADADSFRYTLASNALDDLGEDYRSYYEELWGKTEVLETMDWTDDMTLNHLVLTERYALDDLWRYGDRDDDDYEVWFSPYTLEYALEAPEEVEVRRHPWRLAHPEKLRHRTVLVLPGRDSIEVHDFGEENQYFRFLSRSAMAVGLPVEGFVTEGRTVVDLVYEFESFADSVPPEDLGEVVATMEEIGNQYLAFRFGRLPGRTRASTAREGGAWGDLAFLAIWPLALGVVLFKRHWDKKKEARNGGVVPPSDGD